MPLEWLIDNIKEWVISQAYATEAWVLEWITPVNVTGDITLNVTCTYFKAGTHSGKPYYRSQDGVWFIWWWYDGWWYIGTEVGRETPYTWWKFGPEIEGDYAPLYGATGTATVSVGRKYLCTGFVDRGDPATPDWTQATLIADGAYHDLDLGGIVPVGTKGVLFTTYLFGDHVHWSIELRRKGNVNTATSNGMLVMIVGLGNWGDVTCAVDENRKIEYKLPNETWTLINMTVKGWWL